MSVAKRLAAFVQTVEGRSALVQVDGTIHSTWKHPSTSLRVF